MCCKFMYAYFLELKLPTPSEKILRLIRLSILASIFYEWSWQICYQGKPSSIFLFQILPFTFIMATENKDV